jgi:hypothetical protein
MIADDVHSPAGYGPWLNSSHDGPLAARLRSALTNASSLSVAVAYAKTSGVGQLRPLPAKTRAVIGLGFGVTDPQAVERLAAPSLRLVATTAKR